MLEVVDFSVLLFCGLLAGVDSFLSVEVVVCDVEIHKGCAGV